MSFFAALLILISPWIALGSPLDRPVAELDIEMFTKRRILDLIPGATLEQALQLRQRSIRAGTKEGAGGLHWWRFLRTLGLRPTLSPNEIQYYRAYGELPPVSSDSFVEALNLTGRSSEDFLLRNGIDRIRDLRSRPVTDLYSLPDSRFDIAIEILRAMERAGFPLIDDSNPVKFMNAEEARNFQEDLAVWPQLSSIKRAKALAAGVLPANRLLWTNRLELRLRYGYSHALIRQVDDYMARRGYRLPVDYIEMSEMNPWVKMDLEDSLVTHSGLPTATVEKLMTKRYYTLGDLLRITWNKLEKFEERERGEILALKARIKAFSKRNCVEALLLPGTFRAGQGFTGF